MTRILLIVCAMMFVVPAVHAQSGNELVETCKTYQGIGTPSDGICLGYISGTNDGYRYALKLRGLKPDYCYSDNVTNGQLVKVVVKYLNDHPERLQYSADSLILDALFQAFPCSAEPEKPKK
jgi:Rap1a immunity proteins